MIALKDTPALATAGLTFLGAFSRFTHGRYTPSFYQYQIDHAPDDASTRYIPVLDTIVGTMLLLPQTRAIGAMISVFFLAIGAGLQIQKRGKPEYISQAVLTFAVAAVAAWLSWE